MEFDRDQRFLLLLFLLTGSGEPLPRPSEDELLGNLYLPENDSLAVNAAIRSPDLHEVGAARPHIMEIRTADGRDRKSTRLNSSHVAISYAVFCLKKKKTSKHPFRRTSIACG